MDSAIYGETDMFGGARAIANFLQGATLTVTGSIWDVTDALTPVQVSSYDTIMVAAIQADFYVFEHEMWPDEIAAQLNMLITGGDLATGAQGFQSLYNGLVNDITLYSVQHPGSPTTPVESFLEDIIYTDDGSLMQIYPVPEPATIAFLGIGGLALLRRLYNRK